eukprot:TRINITY_DN42822_c0_g2_i1.p1 TRINITY_DN42822_c0_g2~~TRINITY_DN42822_c0_g2_i1.p1  ORF type:complete len:719 (+),score=91.55 TRINITY_DN42822_c0_g2_i1:217-2373(+)
MRVPTEDDNDTLVSVVSAAVVANSTIGNDVWASSEHAEGDWGSTDAFRIIFCLTQAVVLASHFNEFFGFYRWFLSAPIPQAKMRGLGFSASRVYGVWSPPALSESQFCLVGGLLLASLVFACVDAWAPRFFLMFAFVLHLLFYSQLFCEAHVGGHSMMLTPSVIFLLACAPPCDGHDWPLEAVKILLATMYLGSGLCKLMASAVVGHCWFGGDALQCSVFEALWSRSHPCVALRMVQESLIINPRYTTILAGSLLAFELAWPCVLVAPRGVAVAFGLIGSLFYHSVLETLLGSGSLRLVHRAPALMVFVAPEVSRLLAPFAEWCGGPHMTAATSSGTGGLPALTAALAVLRAWQDSPGVIPATMYLLAQLVVGSGICDVFGWELPPLSCCPAAVQRPAARLLGKGPKLFSLVGVNLRRGGVFDAGGPYSPIHSRQLRLSENDLRSLPYAVAFFGTSRGASGVLGEAYNTRYNRRSFVLFTNIDVPPELRALLEALVTEFGTGPSGQEPAGRTATSAAAGNTEETVEGGWSRERAERALVLQRRARRIWMMVSNADVYEARKRRKDNVVGHHKSAAKSCQDGDQKASPKQLVTADSFPEPCDGGKTIKIPDQQLLDGDSAAATTRHNSVASSKVAASVSTTLEPEAAENPPSVTAVPTSPTLAAPRSSSADDLIAPASEVSGSAPTPPTATPLVIASPVSPAPGADPAATVAARSDAVV